MFDPAITILVVIFCSIAIGFVFGKGSRKGEIEELEGLVKELLGVK